MILDFRSLSNNLKELKPEEVNKAYTKKGVLKNGFVHIKVNERYVTSNFWFKKVGEGKK